ncbi:DUF6163 family protein [Breoghania sp.]|uniref:DUF6163 family protein n=1 Tax=Breoghania sp. TaxID=2065378 RepID=UPI002603393E|nr:DUF6163 family protein [Breoghania sp.]MDJ0932281.1 DUF6163 family protein [Breoghania sp.]
MLSLLQHLARTRLSWRTMLVWYLRLLAILLIGGGIIHWARIVGYLPWRGEMFVDMPVEWQVATAYFGVLDMVAGIGLWLAASWGLVMWFLRVLSQVAMHTVFQDTFGSRPYEITYYILTIAIYLVLTVLTERERRNE